MLAIRVTPRSAKPGLGGWKTDPGGRTLLEIRVAAAPADGAANAEVVKLLRKLWLPKGSIGIVSGETSEAQAHRDVDSMKRDGTKSSPLVGDEAHAGAAGFRFLKLRNIHLYDRETPIAEHGGVMGLPAAIDDRSPASTKLAANGRPRQPG